MITDESIKTEVTQKITDGKPLNADEALNAFGYGEDYAKNKDADTASMYYYASANAGYLPAVFKVLSFAVNKVAFGSVSFADGSPEVQKWIDAAIAGGGGAEITNHGKMFESKGFPELSSLFLNSAVDSNVEEAIQYVNRPKHNKIGKTVVIALGIFLTGMAITHSVSIVLMWNWCMCMRCMWDYVYIPIIGIISLGCYYGVPWAKFGLVAMTLYRAFDWGVRIMQGLMSYLTPYQWFFGIAQVLVFVFVIYILFFNRNVREYLAYQGEAFGIK